jgi:deoxyadenosine/deoxycytidine kinase
MGFSINLFHAMLDYVKPPNLLIYLRADLPKLVDQIQKRNRDFENSIQLEYLKNLNEQYEKWIGNYKHGKLLIIDVNHLDFVSKIEDFAHIVGRIEMELNSLFS